MFLIIEIVLTIVAIKRGCKWAIAMLPIVIVFLVGIMMGVSVGKGNMSLSDTKPIGIMLDIVCVIILVAMIYFNPKKQIDKKSEAK